MVILTAQDRCDRCGAAAKHVARKPGNHDLLFCNHHYNDNRDALLEHYWLVESGEPSAEPTPAYSE